MNRIGCKALSTSIVILLLVGNLNAFAARSLQDAKVIAVKEYAQGRIVYWESFAPIFDGNPVYDITIQVAGKSYLVRYDSLGGYYPAAWKVGSEIKVKPERGRFLLYNGNEAVPAPRASVNDCLNAVAPVPGPYTSPQVPCD